MISIIKGPQELDEAYRIMKDIFYMTSEVCIENGVFAISAEASLEELVRQNYELLAILHTQPQNAEQQAYVQRLDEEFPKIPIYLIDRDFRDKLTYSIRNGCDYEQVDTIRYRNSQSAPSLRAIFRRKPVQDIRSFASSVQKLLILDKVSFARNIANLCKVAVSMGVDGVLFTDPNCDLYSRGILNQIAKESEKFSWTVAPNWPSDIQVLKDAGFELVAMALREDSIRLDDDSLKGRKLAIVMGYEKTGLDSEVIDLCNHTVLIPMSYGVDSLNVNCAGTIAMWELFGKANNND